MLDSFYRTFVDRIGNSLLPAAPIDYAALCLKARPYLLAPFLQLRVGEHFPRLDLPRSSWASGRLTYVSPGGPIDADAWRANLAKIGGWLGHSWEIAAATVSTVTLIRREPMADAVAFDRHLLRPGCLYLGTDVATRQPTYLRIADMTSGTFLPGNSGSGKSNALHVIMQSVLANLASFSAVYLIDGKDGVAAARYRNAAPGKLRVLWEERDVWQLTSSLVTTMRQRNAAQRDAGLDNASSVGRHLVDDDQDEVLGPRRIATTTRCLRELRAIPCPASPRRNSRTPRSILWLRLGRCPKACRKQKQKPSQGVVE